jgi:hypothetical protein
MILGDVGSYDAFLAVGEQAQGGQVSYLDINIKL